MIFQSTLSRRERHFDYFKNIKVNDDFNPRSHEESDLVNGPCRRMHDNFNPRSHEESDINPKLGLNRFGSISIHALTKRATLCSKTTQCQHQSFQSTLSRRERPVSCDSHSSQHFRFQSTLSRRERPLDSSASCIFLAISIHALRRRAASAPGLWASEGLTFQSTLSRRERHVN